MRRTMSELDHDPLPEHVAIIMDGNGRWAEQRGLPRTEGHREGMEAVRRLVRAADDLGVPWLTLFAFSSENWNRPKDEVDLLMQLPERYFELELPEAIERNVRILTVGRRDRLPPNVRQSVPAIAACAWSSLSPTEAARRSWTRRGGCCGSTGPGASIRNPWMRRPSPNTWTSRRCPTWIC
jgi:hypothetical protein